MHWVSPNLAIAGLLSSAAALGVALAAASSGWWSVAVGIAIALGIVVALQPPDLRSPAAVRAETELLLVVLLLGAAMRFVLITARPVGFGNHGTGHLQLAIDLVDRVFHGGLTLTHQFEPLAYLQEQHGPMAVINALGFAVFGVGFA